MANEKISQLGAATTLDGVQYSGIQDGGNVRVPQSLLDTKIDTEIDAAINAAVADLDVVRTVDAETVITVGGGGDYATINEALAAASKLSPNYVKEGNPIEVRLLSGFVMAEQVVIVQKDLSFVTITSEDAEVVVDRSALTEESPSEYVENIFAAFSILKKSNSPVFDVLFNMDDGGTSTGRSGFLVADSTLTIAAGAGMKNAAYRGIHSFRSNVLARATVWDGTGTEDGNAGSAIRAGNSSIVNVRNSSMVGCGGGVVAEHSVVNAQDCDASGSVAAIYADTAMVNASGITADTCTGDVIQSNLGSTVNVSSGSIKNAGGHALTAISGGRIVANGVDVSGATGRGINATFESTVCAQDATISGCGTAVFAQNATVDVRGSDLRNAGDNAINAQEGARVNATGALLTGSGAVNISCQSMSVVNVRDCDISNSADTALYADYGGTILAEGCNLSGAVTYGAQASNGGKIIAIGADITNIDSTRAVSCTTGSEMDIRGATLSCTSSTEIHISDGSVVRANEAVNGSAQPVKPVIRVNTMTEDGIVFSDAAIVAEVGDASYWPEAHTPNVVHYDVALTANRNVNLPGPSVYRSPVRVVRTTNATGAFDLNLVYSSNTIVALAPGEWCEVAPNAAFNGWLVVAKGSLD